MIRKILNFFKRKSAQGSAPAYSELIRKVEALEASGTDRAGAFQKVADDHPDLIEKCILEVFQ